MIKKRIKYTDYNGVTREEDYFFHMTRSELTEWEFSKSGGLTGTMQRIVDAQDFNASVQIFKELVLKAYGEKSPDGKYFMKEDENGHKLANKFRQCEAYNVLFMELATDTDKAVKFIQGIADVSDADMKRAAKEMNVTIPTSDTSTASPIDAEIVEG